MGFLSFLDEEKDGAEVLLEEMLFAIVRTCTTQQGLVRRTRSRGLRVWSVRDLVRPAEASSVADGGDQSARTEYERRKEGLFLFPSKLLLLKKSESERRELTSLVLSDNFLLEIPSSVGQFTSLRQLHLSGNMILDLPSGLEHLVKLEILDVRHNRLSRFPAAVPSLPCLQQLLLGHNQIAQIPSSLLNAAALPVLCNLDLSSNLLRANSFDPDAPYWSSLSCLSRLDIRHNDLDALPPLHRSVLFVLSFCLVRRSVLFCVRKASLASKTKVCRQSSLHHSRIDPRQDGSQTASAVSE